MDHSYSLEELQERIKLIDPSWFGKIETWDDLSKQPADYLKYKLKRDKFIPFLYELSRNGNVLSGHWMVIIDRGEAVEVFDSHGSKINPLEWFKDKKVLDHVEIMSLEKIEPILSNKLFACGYKYVDWNNKPLQSRKYGVSTCGRWVLFRLFYNKLFPDKDVDDFVEFAKKLSKVVKKSPDRMIIDLF